MEQTCDTMLVIGNGFDLTFGLKTSYTDFMKWFNRNYSFRSYFIKVEWTIYLHQQMMNHNIYNEMA